MYVSTSEIVQKANSIVAQCGTRDSLRIARDLGIEVRYYPFKEQRGAYKVMMRNRFIFLKNDLHPVMENIVLLHEIGHDRCIGMKLQKPVVSRNLRYSICGTIGWSMKPTCSLLRFPCRTRISLNWPKEDMTRNRSPEHYARTSTLLL